MSSSLYKLLQSRENQNENTVADMGSTLATMGALGYGISQTLKADIYQNKKTHLNDIKEEFKKTTKPTNQLGDAGLQIKKDIERMNEALLDQKAKAMNELVSSITDENNLQKILQAENEGEARAFIASLYESVLSNQKDITDSEATLAKLKTAYSDVSSLETNDIDTLNQFFKQNIATDPNRIASFNRSYSQKKQVKHLLTNIDDPVSSFKFNNKHQIQNIQNVRNHFNNFNNADGILNKVESRFNAIQGMLKGSDVRLDLVGIDEFGDQGIGTYYARMTFDQKRSLNIPLHIQQKDGLAYIRATSNLTTRYVPPLHVIDATNLVKTGSGRSIATNDFGEAKVSFDDYLFNGFVNRFDTRQGRIDLQNLSNREIDAIHAHVRDLTESAPRTQVFGGSNDRLVSTLQVKSKFARSTIPIVGLENYDSNMQQKILPMIMRMNPSEYGGLSGAQATLRQLDDPFNRGGQITYGMLQQTSQGFSPIEQLKSFSGTRVSRDVLPQTAREGQMFGKGVAIGTKRDISAKVGLMNNLPLYATGSDLIGLGPKADKRITGANIPDLLFFNQEKQAALGLGEGMSYLGYDPQIKYTAVKTVVEQGIDRYKAFKHLVDSGGQLHLQNPEQINQFFKEFGTKGEVIFGSIDNRFAALKKQGDMQELLITMNEESFESGRQRYHLEAIVTASHGGAKMYGLSMKDTVRTVNSDIMKQYINKALGSTYTTVNNADQLLKSYYGDNSTHLRLGTTDFTKKSVQYIQSAMYGGYLQMGGNQQRLDTMLSKINDDNILDLVNNMSPKQYNTLQEAPAKLVASQKLLAFSGVLKSAFDTDKIDIDKQSRVFSYLTHLAMNNEKDLTEDILRKQLGLSDPDMTAFRKAAEDGYIVTNTFKTVGTRHQELVRNPAKTEARFANYLYGSLRGIYGFSSDEATSYISSLIKRQQGVENRLASMTNMKMLGYSIGGVSDDFLNKQYSELGVEKFTLEEIEALRSFKQGQEKELVNFLSGIDSKGIGKTLDLTDIIKDESLLKRLQEKFGGKTQIFLPGADLFDNLMGMEIKSQGQNIQLEHALTRSTMDLINSIFGFENIKDIDDYTTSIRGLDKVRSDIGEIVGTAMRNVSAGRVLGSGTFLGEGFYVAGKGERIYSEHAKINSAISQKVKNVFNKHTGYVGFADAQAFLDGMTTYREALKKEGVKDIDRRMGETIRDFFVGMHRPSGKFTGTHALVQRNPILGFGHLLPDLPIYRMDIGPDSKTSKMIFEDYFDKHRFREFTDVFKTTKITPEIRRRQSQYATSTLNLNESAENYFNRTSNFYLTKENLNKQISMSKLQKSSLLESIERDPLFGRTNAKIQLLNTQEETFLKMRAELYESKYNLQNKTTNVNYLLGIEKIRNEKSLEITSYKTQAYKQLNQEIENIHLDPDLTVQQKNEQIENLRTASKDKIQQNIQNLKQQRKDALTSYKELHRDNRSIAIQRDIDELKASDIENIYKKAPLGVVDAYTAAAVEYQANKQLLPDLLTKKQELLQEFKDFTQRKLDLKKQDPYKVMSIDKDTGEIKYSKGLNFDNQKMITESLEEIKVLKNIKRNQLQKDIQRYKNILRLEHTTNIIDPSFDFNLMDQGRTIKTYLSSKRYAVETISQETLKKSNVSQKTFDFLSSLRGAYLPEEIQQVSNEDLLKLKNIIPRKIIPIGTQTDLDIEKEIPNLIESFEKEKYKDLDFSGKYHKESLDKIKRLQSPIGLTQKDYLDEMIRQYKSFQADPTKNVSPPNNSQFMNMMNQYYGINNNRQGLTDYFKGQVAENTEYLQFERNRFDKKTGKVITENQRFMSPLAYTFLNLTQGSGTLGIDEQISIKRNAQKEIKDINQTLLDADFYGRKDRLQSQIEEINRPITIPLSDSTGVVDLNIYQTGKSVNKQAIDHYQQKINNINEKIDNIRNERSTLIQQNKDAKQQLRSKNIDPINQKLEQLRNQKQLVQKQINKRLTIQEEIKTLQKTDDYKDIAGQVFQDFRQQRLPDNAFETAESKIPELRRLERFHGSQIKNEEDLLEVEAKIRAANKDQLNVGDFITMRSEGQTITQQVEGKFNLEDDYFNLYLKIHQRHLDYAPQGGGKYYAPEISLTASLVNEHGQKVGEYSGRMDFNRFSIGDFDGDIYQIFFNTKSKEQTEKLTQKLTSEKMYDYGAKFLLQFDLLSKGMSAYGKRMGSANMDLVSSQLDELAKEAQTKQAGALDVQVKTAMLGLIQHASSLGEDAFEHQFKAFQSGASLITVAQEIINFKAKKLPMASKVAERFSSLLRESFKTGSGKEVADFFFQEIYKDTAFEKAQRISIGNDISFQGVTDDLLESYKKTAQAVTLDRDYIYETMDILAKAGKKYGTAMIGSNSATAQALLRSDRNYGELFTDLFSRYGTIEGGLMGSDEEEVIDVVQRAKNAVSQSSTLFSIPRMGGAVGLGVAAVGLLGALKSNSSLSDVNAKFSDMRSRELLSSTNMYKNQQAAMDQVSPETLNPFQNFYERPINPNQTVVQSHTNTHIYGEAPTMSSMAMLGRTMMSSGGTSSMFINDNRQPLSRHYINDLMTG